jgi:VWFA-related protein
MKQAGRAFLLVLLGLYAAAQESDVARVIIPLIANGSHHRPTSISVESLVITDQRTQVVGASLLRGADLPVELGVLIDTSNSQRLTDIDDILKAANQFVAETIRGREDRVFLMNFDTTAQATGWLTKDHLQNVSVKLRFGGGTALFDALATACKVRMGTRDWKRPTRRALVLVSDGDDNHSRITRGEAVSEALRSGATIFTIDTGISVVPGRGEKTMEYFAKLTGGESFSGLRGQDIPKAFASIREQTDGMYYLSYVPPDASKSATHEVDVKPASKSKLELSYAKRYFWNP